MTTLPNTGIVLPTRGAPGSGLWADALDAALSLVDAHDHTSGKGARVPTAGLNINADLTFGGLYAPTNLHRLSFSELASLSGNNKSLYVKTDHELYWKSNAGTEVKLTNGAALNVAAFTGGIAGDYASVGAQVAFDDAGDRYTFKQNSATGWARLASGDVRLFETGTSETVFVGLAAPSALAASYTVTMPLAAPGSTSLVQMDSSGVLTASNTVANAATFSTSISTPTIGNTPNFTGAVTMASTLGVTGLITATAGATAAANQHVTVSGTGQFKHGSRQIDVHISAFSADGASSFVSFNQIGYISGFSAVCTVQAWVPLPAGKRLLTYRQYYDVQGTGASITPRLRRMNLSTSVITDVVAGSADNTGTGIESQNLTVGGGGHTILANEAYFIEVSVTNGSHRVHGASISYDEP